MKEALRVLKPGAHGLVWAIPRTSHWTASALEDAGFEIRDVVTHIFGSGFPKSMDISKAIDKAAGAEREMVPRIRVDGKATGHKISNGLTMQESITDISITTSTTGITPEAKQWQGWGTALKPASEHWILVRKPISEKTVAANVLKHGTGGINIDASRIGTEQRSYSINGSIKSGNFGNGANEPAEERAHKTVSGRFPANLVLSHNPDCYSWDLGDGESHPGQCTPGCAVAVLDEQSGERPAGYRVNPSTQSGSKFQSNQGVGERGYKDTGGASRFFYCAKPSKSAFPST